VLHRAGSVPSGTPGWPATSVTGSTRRPVLEPGTRPPASPGSRGLQALERCARRRSRRSRASVRAAISWTEYPAIPPCSPPVGAMGSRVLLGSGDGGCARGQRPCGWASSRHGRLPTSTVGVVDATSFIPFSFLSTVRHEYGGHRLVWNCAECLNPPTSLVSAV
jgi:hypothetical protein